MEYENYSDYRISLPNARQSGEVTAICPECSSDRKKKNIRCLSVNLDKKVWKCHHCGWAGALKTIKTEPPKVYQKPTWKNKTTLSDRVVKWFEGRKIPQNVLLEARITCGEEYMPQVGAKRSVIEFNYFRKSELVNIKYRDGDKNFKLFKDAELIFYNHNAIKNESEEVYILEGEMDCLAMMAAGIKNVVSVPNGANLQNNNLKYVDNCIDEFEGVKKIHLALDNDMAGRKLRDELADRFGRERCDFIIFGQHKDANDCLIADGISGVHKAIANPIEFPLEGCFTISDYENEIDDMYENGLDFAKGYITTITGIPSHGKSQFVDFITLLLNKKHNWKGAFYSPENKPTQLHFSKMARRIIGKSWDGENRITKSELDDVKYYLEKKFWFIKPEKDFSLKSILDGIRMLQIRHGLDFFVIDAWNKLEHKETDTHYIGRALDELAVFCEINNLHCFLVAHPYKMKKDKVSGKYEIPTLYDIMGSSNFFNKTDNGICVYRDFETNLTNVIVQKVKFEHWGAVCCVDMKYDVVSGRYSETNSRADNTNWLTGVDNAIMEYKEIWE
jgi:twinkle protein